MKGLDEYIVAVDGVDALDPECEDCVARNRADDPDWSCPLDYDRGVCIDGERADSMPEPWEERL